MTKKSVTFGAVGDIAFSGHTGAQMLEHGPMWPFELVRPELRRAELLFGNMESVSIPPSFPRKLIDPKGLISPVPGPVWAAALREAGFDFMNLAANHVLDAGRVGLEHTRRCLEAAGIATAGVGRTQREARRMAVLERGGLAFGFLCYAEDTNYSLGHVRHCHAYYTLENVLEDVERHRRDVDVLVVSIYADLEFMPTPSVPRRDNFREIARAGARIVLGHHPHVPQGAEMVGASLVACSLGNFVFDAHTSRYMRENGPHTADSLLLLVDVDRRRVRGFERVPFKIGEPPGQRPAPLAARARARMLARFRQLDRWLADDAFVRRTWRTVAREHLAAYIRRAAADLDEHGLDHVIEDLVARLCLVAENRSWLGEILRAADEYWEVQRRHDITHQRPLTVANRIREAARASNFSGRGHSVVKRRAAASRPDCGPSSSVKRSGGDK